jgi:hypothetical protein
MAEERKSLLLPFIETQKEVNVNYKVKEGIQKHECCENVTRNNALTVIVVGSESSESAFRD